MNQFETALAAPQQRRTFLYIIVCKLKTCITMFNNSIEPLTNLSFKLQPHEGVVCTCTCNTVLHVNKAHSLMFETGIVIAPIFHCMTIFQQA